jgi:hypothetical protein
MTLPNDFKPFKNTRLFIDWCRNSSNLDIEVLNFHKLFYNFTTTDIKLIIFNLCINPHTTQSVLSWIILNYESTQSDLNDRLVLYLISNSSQSELDYNLFKFVIDYMYVSAGNLQFFTRDINTYSMLINNKSFTPQMLNLMLELDPAINIEKCYHQLIHTHGLKMCKFVQVILNWKMKITIGDLKLKESQLLRADINKIAIESKTSDDCEFWEFIIKLSGELFCLLDQQNITQTLCNHFYSSKYFADHPDQDSLMMLIPDEFKTGLFKFGSKTKIAKRITNGYDCEF